MTEEELKKVRVGSRIRFNPNGQKTPPRSYTNRFTEGKVYRVIRVDKNGWLSHKTDKNNISGYKFIYYDLIQTPLEAILHY